MDWTVTFRSEGSGLLRRPSDVMSTFDPSHNKVLKDPQRYEASGTPHCTHFFFFHPDP